jgi:hypothetical protein
LEREQANRIAVNNLQALIFYKIGACFPFSVKNAKDTEPAFRYNETNGIEQEMPCARHARQKPFHGTGGVHEKPHHGISGTPWNQCIHHLLMNKKELHKATP